MSPGQDPAEFLYELDTRRERLNACEPPEGPTDVNSRTSSSKLFRRSTSASAHPPREARLRDRRHSPHDVRYLCGQSCPFGRGAAISTAGDNHRDVFCHYCERAGQIKNTCPLSAPSTSSSDNNESNGTNSITAAGRTASTRPAASR